MINPVWSATTCGFLGAGVYLGLAPRFEHLIVARRLSARQVRLFTGSTVGIGRGAAPLDYYAVRDPSVVRVSPVHQPPRPNGFRHVKLAFQFEHRSGAEEAVVVARPSAPCGKPISEAPVAFLLTIGLVNGQEQAFYRDVVADWPSQEFADLYARIAHLAGRPS